MTFFLLERCTLPSLPEEEGTLKILSSFSILSDMIQEIGGEKVEVYNLVPIGKAPHEYAPVPNDLKFASRADAVFYNGLNLEGGERGWLMKLCEVLRIEETRIFCATDGIAPIYLDAQEKEINPHAFISPHVGLQMANNIEKYLCQLDAENAPYYEEQAAKYRSQLHEIERQYRKEFFDLPEEQKVFVTSELAYQYLTKEYGLKEGFIWAIDTEKNGTPQQIKETIAFIEQYQPKILFVESNVDAKPMEKISAETGIPICKKRLLSDELGKPGNRGETYLDYLSYNLEVISEGLRN